MTASTASGQAPSLPEAVGVVGLGLVGTALSHRLRAAGVSVLGFDHHPPAAAAWCARFPPAVREGPTAAVASSLEELGQRCAAVVLAVFDTQGLLEVVEGAGGLLAGAAVGHPGARTRVLIDCSTGEPDTLAALATRLAARGLDFIEAPLSGSSAQIGAGTATMLLGAGAGVLQRHGPLLEALSPHRVHVGGAGMGARAKLATNLVLGLNRAALAEGLVFAERLGIAPQAFLALVLATPARSEAAVQKGGRMVRGDFTPQSRIHQHLKDVELMLAEAAGRGQALPLTAAHAALLRAAVAHGDGDLDNAAIVRQLRRAGEAPAEPDGIERPGRAGGGAP